MSDSSKQAADLREAAWNDDSDRPQERRDDGWSTWRKTGAYADDRRLIQAS